MWFPFNFPNVCKHVASFFGGGGERLIQNFWQKSKFVNRENPNLGGEGGLIVNAYTFNQFPLFLLQFYLHTSKKVGGTNFRIILFSICRFKKSVCSPPPPLQRCYVSSWHIRSCQCMKNSSFVSLLIMRPQYSHRKSNFYAAMSFCLLEP